VERNVECDCEEYFLRSCSYLRCRRIKRNLKRAASYPQHRRTAMKTAIRATAAAGLAAGLMIASSAFAIALPSTQDFGRAADGAFADRVIMLTPETQSVGVYRNQTVKFIDAASGRSATWRF